MEGRGRVNSGNLVGDGGLEFYLVSLYVAQSLEAGETAQCPLYALPLHLN
jgi:hypothetical protein